MNVLFSHGQAIAKNPAACNFEFPFTILCNGKGEVAEQLGDDLSDAFRVEVNRVRGYNSSYHGRPSRVISIVVTRRLKAVAA